MIDRPLIDRAAPRAVARTARLRDLLHDCVASTAAEEAARLRDAAWLLPAMADVPRLEAMIACGAGESAAALLLGAGSPYLLSRGTTGVCLASAMLANGEEITAEAATPALALLAAHVAALLAEQNRTPVAARRSQLPASARFH